MKLIFKNFSEVKKTLGFLDADYKFENIVPDLISATREVIKVIGKETYDVILSYSEADLDIADTDYNKKILLIDSLRAPIASKAYLLFAPSNDISHSANGRKMRNEEHEKNAFEWMIEKDNENLEKRYYRSLNDLILVLDETELEQWVSSDEYKNEKNLFVNSMDIFDRYHPIESRLLYLKLRPALKRCENRHILPLIGKLKFDALKENREPIIESDMELLELIYEACINFSLANTIPLLSIHILPDGIVQLIKSEQVTLKASKIPELSEAHNSMQLFQKIFQQAVNDIQLLLNPESTLDDILDSNQPCNKFFTM